MSLGVQLGGKKKKTQRTITPVFAYTNVAGKTHVAGSTMANMVTQNGVPVSQTWVAMMGRLKATEPRQHKPNREPLDTLA